MEIAQIRPKRINLGLSFGATGGAQSRAQFQPHPTSKKPPVNRHAKIITTLLGPNKSAPPTTEKRLTAYIKTGLGKESTDTKTAEIMDELKQRGVTIDDKGRVAYPR